MITNVNQLDLNENYTYADYLTWQFKERVELIMGKIFRMPPAPGTNHQVISVAIARELSTYLKNEKCIFTAPFDVRLPIKDARGNENTVVQPDICVICDPSKIDSRGCKGSPDLVIEIVSKSSVKTDLHEKHQLYEQCGVKEYWIVQPGDKTLSIFLLDENKQYVASKPLTYGDTAISKLFSGFSLDLEEIFKDMVEEPYEGYGEDVSRI